ncbi:hypothetical protein LEP1GSC061_3181 [Leptospira wolffii serovar Khorat str. Khorat-H2]|nr:hypothetical protein LEP1GSC061_3181 [Leptospira wolffii serovar Khorat str. Khorat-H2]
MLKASGRPYFYLIQDLFDYRRKFVCLYLLNRVRFLQEKTEFT